MPLSALDGSSQGFGQSRRSTGKEYIILSLYCWQNMSCLPLVRCHPGEAQRQGIASHATSGSSEPLVRMFFQQLSPRSRWRDGRRCWARPIRRDLGPWPIWRKFWKAEDFQKERERHVRLRQPKNFSKSLNSRLLYYLLVSYPLTYQCRNNEQVLWRSWNRIINKFKNVLTCLY